MKTFKAKIREIADDEFEILVFIAGLWRCFGTPYKKSKNIVKGFKNKKTVRRAGEKVAAALGVKLTWEV